MTKEPRRHCVRTDGKCGDQYCGNPKGEPCIYEYVEKPGDPYNYTGDAWPPPRRWLSADGKTIVYRTYSDYCN